MRQEIRNMTIIGVKPGLTPGKEGPGARLGALGEGRGEAADQGDRILSKSPLVLKDTSR
jgi:hypothetical protein